MRDPLDRYYTPDDVAFQLVRWMAVPADLTVIEPSVGDGAFVRALRATGHRGRIIGVDVDPDAAGLHLVDEAHVGDWPTVAGGLRADVLVGNPPFKPALDHLRASLRAGRWVAMLARATWVEATVERAALWSAAAPVEEWTIGDRIRFLGPSGVTKTDSVCHSMFFWRLPVRRQRWARQLVSVKRDLAPAPLGWWA